MLVYKREMHSPDFTNSAPAYSLLHPNLIRGCQWPTLGACFGWNNAGQGPVIFRLLPAQKDLDSNTMRGSSAYSAGNRYYNILRNMIIVGN